MVAAPDYRFSGEAAFPAQLDDALEAWRWLHAHAGELGVDPDRTYLWGASAGGHLAALAALAPLDEVRSVAGAVCWYPVTDLPPSTTVGRPASRRTSSAARSASTSTWPEAASPVTHVHAGAPPILLQHGDADTWVPCEQSVLLAEALRGGGRPVELEIVPGADHFFGGSHDVEGIFDRAVAFLLAARPCDVSG